MQSTRIITLKGLQELFRAMGDTPQDARFHPEGSVLAHTVLLYDMVCRRGYDLLGLSAIFHDVGKITTTVDRGGRYNAPDHEKASAAFVRLLRREPIWHNLDHYLATEYVVRNHMRIKYRSQMRPAKLRKLKDEGMSIRWYYAGYRTPVVCVTGWELLQVFTKFDRSYIRFPDPPFCQYDFHTKGSTPPDRDIDRFLIKTLPAIWREAYGPFASWNGVDGRQFRASRDLLG